MQITTYNTGADLSDSELLERVEALARRERHAAVELVAHLAELDKRRLYREQGYGSLFSYCIGALHLAEHAAFNRIEAARASRAFPVILDLLADGSINLTTVRLLAPHLTTGNHEKLLAEAKGRSKREVEELVARLAPRADVPACVRKLPARVVAFPESPMSQTPEAPIGDPPTSAPASAPCVPTHRPVVAPLTPERYGVHFTVGRETHEKLRLAQDLLRREIPDGDPGIIFDRALTLLLAEVARRKLAATAKPRPGGGTGARKRHVPAAIRRAVWLRDGGRCAFVSRDGRRCREGVFLEFHHVEPYGVGGETTAGNLSLRCGAHNAYEAELLFGTRPGASSTPALGEGARAAPMPTR
jgi:hypothetical protein